MTALGRVGGAAFLLYAGHCVGDYWVQRSRDAEAKGGEGAGGRWACARHVASLTATQAVFLTAGVAATGERLRWRRVAAGLAVNAATHYWADRRTPLRQLADRTGNGDLYRLGQGGSPLACGAHALDQSWHIAWVAGSALIMAGGQ